MNDIRRAILSEQFTYHPPIGNQTRRYEVIREKAKELALMIEDACPDSGEKTLALVGLRESVMWANASIAINENVATATRKFQCCGRDRDSDGNCDHHPVKKP